MTDHGRDSTSREESRSLGTQIVHTATMPKIDTSALLGMKGIAEVFGASFRFNRAVLPPYVNATRLLFEDLGLGEESIPDDLYLSFSADSRAYEALTELAPNVADAVDRAAETVRSPFWSRDAVRNSLSWLLVTLVITLFIGGTFVPWGGALINAVGGGLAALASVFHGAAALAG